MASGFGMRALNHRSRIRPHLVARIVASACMVGGFSAACGGDDGQGNTFGGGGSSGRKGAGGAAGSGVITPDAAGGSRFDAAGGTRPFGGAGPGGNGGSGTCDLANCRPPAPAVPCCIFDLCGGDWGTGCQPFGGSAGSGGGAPVDHLCNHAPPAGAPQAAPPPSYSGTCPQLVDGASGAINTIVSSGAPRRFMMGIPGNLQPSEVLPVVFLWHWLGGDSVNFYNKASAGFATNQQRFLAVFPDAKGDLPLKWPYEVTAAEPRMQEEYRFFDDMYACIAQQFPVQRNCIASGGVSAGALFTDQLAGARSQYIASFASLSGGTGGVIRPWPNPPHKAPAIVLWGGPGDLCGINFEQASRSLEQSLTAGGHFMIECIHNCNHSEPPFDTTPGFTKYAPVWNFVFDHPYWMGPGQSPYAQSGLPAGWPSWCAIGAGRASPRTASGCIPTQCI